MASPAPRSRSTRTLLLAAICLLLLACIGAVAGLSIVWQSRGGGLARWQRLPAPPVPVAGLAAADLNSVYVTGADGALYGCVHQRNVEGPACWSAVAALPPADQSAALNQPELTPRQPPRPVLESLTVTYSYADALFEAHYALLDDGRVWVWEYGSGSYLALAQLCLAPSLGAIAGLVVGGLLLGALALRRRMLSST